MTKTSITRREFGGLLGAGAVGALTSACARRSPGPTARRPNIVFVLVDDQRWDAAGFMGHPFLPTPNIDRIANEGVRFDNAFVTTSLCSPSRACFLTGCYAHTHGVVTNDGNDPDPGCPTFPALLQKRGYETAFIGKWHMAPSAQPRDGFDYWLSFAGQGHYTDPDLNENGRDFKASGYMTDILTDYAVAWLRQPRERPFCLVLSHKAVHGPFTPAARHAEALADARTPEPASYRETLADKPAWLRRMMTYGARRGEWIGSQGRPVPAEIPPQDWDPASKSRLDYYRAMLAVDDSVGRVLRALEASGQLERTAVVYASDNGFFHGEHRRGDKRLAYEESIRIPMVMRYPEAVRPGTACEDLVLNIDLAPTLLELAGAAIPAHMQGASLRPLLAEESARWRESFLYTYFREEWLPSIPLIHGVRSRRWKYIAYPDVDDIEELYDLAADPQEMRNLAGDPGRTGVLHEMRAELRRLLQQTEYPTDRQLGAAPVSQGLRADRPELVALSLTWEGDSATVAKDGSGLGHDGAVQGAELVDTERGPARRFRGGDAIDIPRAEGLDPALGPWTVEAWVKADSPSGVILAHGGDIQGYALTIEAGLPRFYVRVDGSITAVGGEGPVAGRWVHLAGVIGNDGSAKLYVDGKLAGSAVRRTFIGMNPNENLSIGMDRGSCVGGYEGMAGLAGLMGAVRIYAGERTAEMIAADAAAE